MKRIILVTDLPQVAEHLKGLLGREPEVEIAAVHTTGEPALQQAISERPEVLLVDALLQDKKLPPLALAKRVRAASPGTRIVLVTIPQAPVTPRPEEGIDAAFVLPGGANELGDAIGARKEAEHATGEVVVIFSPKGGAGKTTLAVNLACHLRRQGAGVALVDAVMQFGAVRSFLKTPTDARSIVDLPAGAGMTGALDQVLWEGPAGISVLLAPPRPEQAELVSSGDIGAAVTALAKRFDYVVVDTPSRLSEDVLATLDVATSILVVLTYDAAAVASARTALDTFEQLGYTGKKTVLLVLNRSDQTASLSKSGVEQLLGLPAVGEIPYDHKGVQEAANRQEQFVLAQPGSGPSQGIAKLATAVIAQQRKVPA